MKAVYNPLISLSLVPFSPVISIWLLVLVVNRCYPFLSYKYVPLPLKTMWSLSWPSNYPRLLTRYGMHTSLFLKLLLRFLLLFAYSSLAQYLYYVSIYSLCHVFISDLFISAVVDGEISPLSVKLWCSSGICFAPYTVLPSLLNCFSFSLNFILSDADDSVNLFNLFNNNKFD